MKKVILVISAFVISIGAYAQTDSLNKKMSPTDNRTQDGRIQDTRTQQSTDMNKSNNAGDQRMQDNHPDGYMMENGRMVQYKGGKATQLESTGTLANGTKIMSDGTYTTSDGRKMTLKNGEHLGMDGKMVPMSSTNRAGENSRTNTNLQNDKSSTPNSDGNKTNTPK